jgi:hypothetical protein
MQPIALPGGQFQLVIGQRSDDVAPQLLAGRTQAGRRFLHFNDHFCQNGGFKVCQNGGFKVRARGTQLPKMDL